MRASLLFLLVSAGVGLSAQQSALSTPATFSKPVVSEGCPVNFAAELNSRLIVRSIGDQKKHGSSPLLELNFGHLNAPKILSATVTVHGLSSQSLYLPVSKRPDENRIQTFELDREPGAAGLTHSEVAVTRMSFVRWAEVTELRYADGSAWHSSSDARCRAVPSGFRLVDATAH